MRKYGKYEKMPDGTRAKQSTAKNVLLQTYFSSLICILLCVTMFFGTTFAWFTSEVKNVGNEIYIGTLDVGLYKGTTDLSVEGNLFDKDIRWEPGYTSLETIQVVNEGNLAFDYRLTFTDGQVDGKTDESLKKAAKWFDVWVYHNDANEIPAPKNYMEIIDKDSGWLPMGTLAEVLEGKTVCKGKMHKEDVAVKGFAHTYTIALHMKGETVEQGQQEELDALMGQKISLNVKLIATQMCSEEDYFGSNNYDNDNIAYVYNVEELQKALEKGKYVILMNDIEVKPGDIKVHGETLDGNENAVICLRGAASYPGILTTGGTIKNITLDNQGNTVQGVGAGMSHKNPLIEDLYIENVTVYAAYYAIVGTANNVKIVVKDSKLYGGIAYPGASSIEVTNTQFAFEMGRAPQLSQIEVYGNTSFTNCSLDGEYYLAAEADADGIPIRFDNCTVDGEALTADNFEEKLLDTKPDPSSPATPENVKKCEVIVNGVKVVWE